MVYKAWISEYEILSKNVSIFWLLVVASAAAPNIDWIVIVHHDQQYASTAHTLLSRANKWKEAYHPLFDQYDVDLVLQAHQHNYQRTYPIKYNSDTPINPIITDKNRSNYANPEGQILLK